MAAPTVLVIGDSLSAEYGIKRGTGWVSLLSERLARRDTPWRVVNASISGDTTSGGVTRLPALLQQHVPKIVVIELGANDALRGLSLSVTTKNLSTLIDLAQKAGAKVVLVGMQVPPNFGANYTREFSMLFQKLAKQHRTALVPFFFQGMAADPDFFQEDRLHPNERAQPHLLENVWVVLSSLL